MHGCFALLDNDNGLRTFDTLTRANLELGLRAHDLGVGARDFDAGVQAGFVVGIHDVATDHPAGTDATVVGALGGRVAIRRPTKRPAVHIKHRVLLLEAEPGLVDSIRLHQFGALVAVVVLVGCPIVVPTISEHKNVGRVAEGVGEDSDRFKVDV